MDRPSRRRFLHLSSVAIAASTGCLGFFEAPTVADLGVTNETRTSVTVTTTVVRVSDGDEILSDTATLASGESRTYEDPITGDGVYRIHVAVEGGVEQSHEWDAPADEAYGVRASVTDDGIQFVGVAA